MRVASAVKGMQSRRGLPIKPVRDAAGKLEQKGFGFYSLGELKMKLNDLKNKLMLISLFSTARDVIETCIKN